MKKKIILLFVAVSMLAFITGCAKTNSGENKDEQKNKVEDAQSDKNNDSKKDDNSKINIVIDPGHSSTGTSGNEPVSPDSSKTKLKDGLGATGAFTNIPEHKTTMSVASLLKKELESKGYNVVLTKSDVAESKSNIERAEVGNKNNADLVVRIHGDSCEDSSVKGASMHVPANNEYTSSFYKVSKSYGTKILNTYVKEVGIKDRGVIERDDLTGFNWSKVPVVLIEMGFLSNKEDDTFVSNTKNHPKIAKAIADGINKCFE